MIASTQGNRANGNFQIVRDNFDDLRERCTTVSVALLTLSESQQVRIKELEKEVIEIKIGSHQSAQALEDKLLEVTIKLADLRQNFDQRGEVIERITDQLSKKREKIAFLKRQQHHDVAIQLSLQEEVDQLVNQLGEERRLSEVLTQSIEKLEQENGRLHTLIEKQKEEIKTLKEQKESAEKRVEEHEAREFKAKVQDLVDGTNAPWSHKLVLILASFGHWISQK